MSKLRIRPLTTGLVVRSIVVAVVGVVYLTKTAAYLPGLFPSHVARSAKHHVKHGLVAVTLAVVALLAAWFTTAPYRPASTTDRSGV